MCRTGEAGAGHWARRGAGRGAGLARTGRGGGGGGGGGGPGRRAPARGPGGEAGPAALTHRAGSPRSGGRGDPCPAVPHGDSVSARGGFTFREGIHTRRVRLCLDARAPRLSICHSPGGIRTNELCLNRLFPVHLAHFGAITQLLFAASGALWETENNGKGAAGTRAAALPFPETPRADRTGAVSVFSSPGTAGPAVAAASPNLVRGERAAVCRRQGEPQRRGRTRGLVSRPLSCVQRERREEGAGEKGDLREEHRSAASRTHLDPGPARGWNPRPSGA